MLKIIDKYIIKKYLSTFFFTALMFSMIATIIDFSEKVENFIEEPVTKKQIFLEYYLNFIPYINGLLWPLFSLIAVVFFTSRMAYNTEIIPILEAGVSFNRLLRPFMIGAGVLVVLLLIGNHFVIPNGNKYRLHFLHTYVWKNDDKGKTENIHMFIGDGSKVFIKYYRKRDTIANEMRLETFKNGELSSIVEASTAKWIGYPNKWQLQDYRKRTFKGLKESLVVSSKSLDTVLNIVPEDFVRYNNQKEMMPTYELSRFISKEKERGLTPTQNFELEIHRRTADPASIFILTIIGVAVAARKVRGGMGLHLAIGIGLGAAFIVISRFSNTFVTNLNMPALLGVWIPNILFAILGLYLVKRAQQ